jgi:hypothetical protein
LGPLTGRRRAVVREIEPALPDGIKRPPVLRFFENLGRGRPEWPAPPWGQKLRTLVLGHSGACRNVGLEAASRARLRSLEYLEKRINETPDFELRSKGRLSIVCFRYLPGEVAGNEEALDALNKAIMERAQADGTAFVTNTTMLQALGDIAG